MTDFEDDDEVADETDMLEDVSSGRGADDKKHLQNILPASVLAKYEVYSYRSAAGILSQNFPEQLSQLVDALERLQIPRDMIRTPGGSKGPVAKYVDTLFAEDWVESRISADLHVKVLHAKRRDEIIKEYTREGYLDGHRIDFLNGKVALDLEWNSKDQTYDRDLYAFSAYHQAGAIDVGVIITRGSSLSLDYFRTLGKVLDKHGNDGTADVYKKFGASTTWMGKLLYRLDAGRNGGCPVLAIGITPRCIV